MPGSILIVDDVATNRIVLKAKLTGARYNTLQAASAAEALALAAAQRPGLILLDVTLPDMTGEGLIARLRADPRTRRIPIIAMTGRDTPELRVTLLQAGANEVLAKPFDELVLLARLRSLIRAHVGDEDSALREQTCRELGFAEAASDFVPLARIALIAPNPSEGLRWKSALAPLLTTNRILLTSYDQPCGDDPTRRAPDLFVIGADLAHRGDGLRLMSELRSHPETRHAAILIASQPDARETQASALDLGADDLLPAEMSTPLAAKEAALRIGAQLRRKRLSDQLRLSVDEGLRLALVDPLTGLHNRRYVNAHLSRMSDRARRTGHGYAVMLLDLDRFKSVNDTYGHGAGDEVLASIARHLRQSLRDVDLIGRIGGEEFLVALPDSSLVESCRISERLRHEIAQSKITLPDGQMTQVTISIGLAFGGTRHDDPQHLIDEADAALLCAKGSGRNQVSLAQHTNAA
ncbi:response regulator receiver modulated diguanylate cyclase [Thioclava sp. ES.031]|uniref:diguanylate cyclase n=1 Tax=Thioclava sp. ES.031 TaxID=1798203 RepID=UPI000BF828AE|nr:diguanylate cyclase [Thioclava sp. ES.031]PFG64601.1 response regulator receiver modulated diguanylate cyclase [Thioclava sp. ES.031]